MEGSGRRLSYLDHHGQSSIAYEPVKKLLPDSPAGRAAQLLQDSGIRVVVTDGAFETRSGGRSVPHTEAVTAPDGTVYVSSAAQIPAERIAAHESVHVLQNQNSPLYQAYWDELQFQLNSQSQAYEDVAGRINDKHYQGRIDLDDPDSVRRISWELTAHLHEWLQTDPAFAREIFGDLFFDWDAVVRADRALTQGMKASAQGGAANILGKTGEENSDELFSSFLSGVEGRRFETSSDLPTAGADGRMETGNGRTEFNIDKIRPKLKTHPNTAFFWSGRTDGIGGVDVAAEIARRKGGVTLELQMAAQNITMPEWDFNDPSSLEAWDLASAAYAEQASGEVRAVIGTALREGNIWENIELPRLKRNPRVNKITIIDPKTGIETVIFER